MARVLCDVEAGPEDEIDLVIAAPRLEKSAASHAITLHGPIEAELMEHPCAGAAFAVDGTPADCVKLAIKALFVGKGKSGRGKGADEAPELVVSGVNRGPNVGVNVFYSGTVGAALEAVINGVPAVAVSKEFGERLSFDDAARLVAPIIGEVLKKPLPPWHALNVNVPDRPAAEIRALRLTRQGVSGFEEWYREETAEAGSRVRRFCVEGEMRLRETDGTTDAEALADGCVSVTPIALDLTSRGFTADAAGRERWEWLAHLRLGQE